MRELAENTLVDGRYRVLQRLGSGGMADVYCADDIQLERKVALKVLYRRFAQDAEFVERFRREASAAAGLQHPNVVAVYDRGTYEGTYYIAMEYLSGRTLKTVINEEAPLKPERAVAIAKQILQAVRFANRKGIVHRDLKPHNVIVDAEDHAKVTDFGIARAGASDMTETGSILGTAQYLAPEQAQGKEITSAADLYSVGVVLFELLTGRVPFDGDSAVAVALKHVSEKPPSPRQFVPEVSPALERTVLQALAKDPADRFGSAEEFIEALDGAGTGQVTENGAQHTASFAPPSAAEAGAGEELPPEARLLDRGNDVQQAEPVEVAAEGGRGRRWLYWVAALAVVVGGGIGAYLLLSPKEVRVPIVTGRLVEDARAQLGQEGFKVDVKRVASEAPLDTVLEQSPLGGSKLEEGSTLLLTVSKGPDTVPVPNITDLDEVSARRELRDAGLKAKIKEASSTDVAKGNVIKTNPPVGEPAPVGSKVTLIVSSGPPQVGLPSVVGQDRGTAVATLKDLGLNVDIEQVDSKKAKGEVVSQSPTAGTEVDTGSSVTLQVSNGSESAKVPDVVGLSEGSATSRLENAGLNASVRTKQTGDLSQDGVVLSQSPGGDARVAKGDSVTIVVGKFEPDIPPQSWSP